MAVHMPTRGGVRGGQDQFAWEEVKVDKDRENYLGEEIFSLAPSDCAMRTGLRQ